MKFGDDWTGVFIRGDDAFHYALALKGLLEAHKAPEGADEDVESQADLAKMILKGLVGDLLSAYEGTDLALVSDRPKAQKLKPFDACLENGE